MVSVRRLFSVFGSFSVSFPSMRLELDADAQRASFEVYVIPGQPERFAEPESPLPASDEGTPAVSLIEYLLRDALDSREQL